MIHKMYYSSVCVFGMMHKMYYGSLFGMIHKMYYGCVFSFSVGSTKCIVVVCFRVRYDPQNVLQ